MQKVLIAALLSLSLQGWAQNFSETGSTSSVAPPPSGAIFFSPTSWVNTPLPSNPSVDPLSSTMVADSFTSNLLGLAHLSNGAYGIGLVYVHSSDPVIGVHCAQYCPNGATVNFPVPTSGVRLPSGTDGATAFVYAAQDGSQFAGKELDCWGDGSVRYAAGSPPTLTCQAAILVANIPSGWGTCATSQGNPLHCAGGYASGMDYASGAIRPAEIAAGVIPHAVNISINNLGPAIICPATATDAAGHAAGPMPEGAQFFLPKSFNVAATSWPNWLKIIAVAMQNYGAYVTDFSGNFEIRGFTSDNPDPSGVTWTSVGVPVDDGSGNTEFVKFTGATPFPWNLMQVRTMVSCN